MRNEFPEYEKLNDEFVKRLGLQYVWISSEFGYKQYEVAKAIFESGIDKETSMKEIKKVSSSLQSMQAVFYVLLMVCGKDKKNRNRIQDLEYYWQGIGDWQS